MTDVAKKIIRGVAAAGLLGGLCSVGGTPAEARGSGAILGAPAFGSDSSCFIENFGGVRNACTGWRAFVLPATYDNAGTLNFQVAARGVSGTARRVQCQAWSVDSAGGNVRSSSLANTVRHDGVTEYLRVSVNGHGWGAAYAFCWMEQDTLIRNFHY